MKLPKENEILKLEWKENILRYMENFPFEKYGMNKISNINWVHMCNHKTAYLIENFKKRHWSWYYHFFYEISDEKAIKRTWNNKIVYDKLAYDL